jgi:hypothetical protein
MNTRSPYADVEVPELCLPRFILDRGDERGTAVPLMGPADHGTVTPLMGLAAAGTIAPLLGLADRGTMVSLMGLADLGTAKPLMLPSRNASRAPQDGRVARPGRPGWEQIVIPGDRG